MSLWNYKEEMNLLCFLKTFKKYYIYEFMVKQGAEFMSDILLYILSKGNNSEVLNLIMHWLRLSREIKDLKVMLVSSL